MNIMLLKGNLTRDPELRSVTTGDKQTSVVSFTVAVSKEFTRANGNQDKIVSYIQCEAWDSGAEAISASFRKGDLVIIEGSLRNDSWEKDGVKHSTLKVRVNNFAKITRTNKKKVAEDVSEEAVAF
jgi:single-strand DNA-binding protein